MESLSSIQSLTKAEQRVGPEALSPADIPHSKLQRRQDCEAHRGWCRKRALEHRAVLRELPQECFAEADATRLVGPATEAAPSRERPLVLKGLPLNPKLAPYHVRRSRAL